MTRKGSAAATTATPALRRPMLRVQLVRAVVDRGLAASRTLSTRLVGRVVGVELVRAVVVVSVAAHVRSPLVRSGELAKDDGQSRQLLRWDPKLLGRMHEFVVTCVGVFHALHGREVREWGRRKLVQQSLARLRDRPTLLRSDEIHHPNEESVGRVGPTATLGSWCARLRSHLHDVPNGSQVALSKPAHVANELRHVHHDVRDDHHEATQLPDSVLLDGALLRKSGDNCAYPLEQGVSVASPSLAEAERQAAGRCATTEVSPVLWDGGAARRNERCEPASVYVATVHGNHPTDLERARPSQEFTVRDPIDLGDLKWRMPWMT